MEDSPYHVIRKSFGSICKLEWVQGFKEDGYDVLHDETLKAIHDSNDDASATKQ